MAGAHAADGGVQPGLLGGVQAVRQAAQPRVRAVFDALLLLLLLRALLCKGVLRLHKRLTACQQHRMVVLAGFAGLYSKMGPVTLREWESCGDAGAPEGLQDG